MRYIPVPKASCDPVYWATYYITPVICHLLALFPKTMNDRRVWVHKLYSLYVINSSSI
jgi:hypothetical protein